MKTIMDIVGERLAKFGVNNWSSFDATYRWRTIDNMLDQHTRELMVFEVPRGMRIAAYTAIAPVFDANGMFNHQRQFVVQERAITEEPKDDND